MDLEAKPVFFSWNQLLNISIFEWVMIKSMAALSSSIGNQSVENSRMPENITDSLEVVIVFANILEQKLWAESFWWW